jgi:hypothetical protein
MRVKIVGGRRDGETIEVPEPPPPILRFPEPDPGNLLAYHLDSPISAQPAMRIVDYKLARRLDTSEPCYVEIGTYERWTSSGA